jgi:hypothetical protein
MNVIRNNTSVTSAIFLGELNWTPFLDEVKDRRSLLRVEAKRVPLRAHSAWTLNGTGAL